MPFPALPPDFFRPLAGRHRDAYAAVLSRLHQGPFSLEMLDAPRRQEVVAEVGEALSGFNAGLDADAVRLSPAEVYAELLATGWIEEQKEGWDTFVEMAPSAARMLDSLLLPDTRPDGFGSAMVAVVSNLESAMQDPRGHAQGIAEAARRSREFARHMRTVVGSLRGIERNMVAQATLNGVVRTFFEDFVDQIMLRDYRSLTSARDHPYGFKFRIADMVDDIVSDGARMEMMAKALVAQAAEPAIADATRALSRDLRDIRASLESTEVSRWRIDAAKARIEERFGNTLRYLDAFGTGDGNRFGAAFSAFGMALAGADDEAGCDMPTRLGESLVMFDAAHLPTPPIARKAVEPVREREATPDPLRVAFEQAKREFDRMLATTPERFMSYVDTKLGDSATVAAADIPPTDVSELILFSMLRAMPEDRIRLPRGVVLERRDGIVDNRWITMGDFVLRRASSAEQAHAG